MTNYSSLHRVSQDINEPVTGYCSTLVGNLPSLGAITRWFLWLSVRNRHRVSGAADGNLDDLPVPIGDLLNQLETLVRPVLKLLVSLQLAERRPRMGLSQQPGSQRCQLVRLLCVLLGVSD